MSKSNMKKKAEGDQFTKEQPQRNRTVNSKPSNYNKTLQMAKKMLNADGINYYKWLDEQHKEIIFDKVLDNKEDIVDVLNK